MSTPDSTDGKDKVDLANLGPIENLSFDEATAFLVSLYLSDIEAENRLSAEPYPPTALIEIARRADVDVAGTVGDCFESVDQMAAFASDRMSPRLASTLAAHIASGCTDCGEKFEAFAKEVIPALEAWGEKSDELVDATKLKKSENLDSVQAADNVALAALEASIARARANYEAVLAAKSE